MMEEIIVLSQETVNRISAGEVIERPASVVKELIENSLDAGADEIKVEVGDGGKKFITVKDNGAGMRAKEVELAFEKHSTSKIRCIDDLNDLETLGFRGEGLSSIAAVARVRVATKLQGAIEGTEFVIHGGEKKELRDIGCPEGTTVEVNDLFYNTPARRKYLKRTGTEFAHISEVVTRYALAHPEIKFVLFHNDNELLFTPKTDSLEENIKHIYGVGIARKMVMVDTSDSLLSVKGALSKPEISRSTRDHIYTYVNNRYVNNPMLRDAVMAGYSTMLPKKRYPIVVLNIDIAGEEIDVNVHPTKIKIRFLNGDRVKEEVSRGVRYALLGEDLVPSPKTVREEDGDVKKEESEEKAEMTRQQSLELEEGNDVPESKLSQMRVIGILYDKYIIAETPEGMAVIDQHAAHERINYERIKKAIEGRIDSQRLVSPVNIELRAREAAIIRANEGLLKNLGFHIEPFGKTTFRVIGLPVVLGELQEKEIIHSVIDELMAMKGSSLDDRREEMIRYMACHSSVTAGDMLSVSSARDLLIELGHTDNPYTCPHGRPTIIKFSTKEMDKWFKRT